MQGNRRTNIKGRNGLRGVTVSCDREMITRGRPRPPKSGHRGDIAARRWRCCLNQRDVNLLVGPGAPLGAEGDPWRRCHAVPANIASPRPPHPPEANPCSSRSDSMESSGWGALALVGPSVWNALLYLPFRATPNKRAAPSCPLQPWHAQHPALCS